MYLHHPLYLEKPPDPPNLPRRVPSHNSQLEYTPPLYPRICAFGRIPMVSLPHDDVFLFIFNLAEQFRELTNLVLKWVAWRASWGWFRNIYDSVNVKRDFFGGSGVIVVREAVDVPAIMFDRECVYTGGDSAFVDLKIAQKSISKFPECPNSLSPT